jgi:gas vesicle protein
MNNSRVLAVTILGAVVGSVAGYLFFTESGRSVRRQIEPALDDLAKELESFRGTVMKAAGAAGEGWKLLNEVLEDTSPRPTVRYPGRQTSPF